VLVPGFYGPYGDYIPSVVQNYSAATNPILAGPPSYGLNATFLPARLSIPAGQGLSPGLGLRYDYRLAAKASQLNVTEARWLTANFTISNMTRIAQLVGESDLWFGLSTANASTVDNKTTVTNSTAWFTLGLGSNAVVDHLNATTLTVSVLPTAPSTNNTGYDPFNVTDVFLWARDSVGTFGLLKGFSGLSEGNATDLVPSWVARIDTYGMGYLLIDKSIVGGNEQPYTLVQAIVASLNADGDLVLLHTGPYLDLYEIIAVPFASAASPSEVSHSW
jgi:hypothetical protein